MRKSWLSLPNRNLLEIETALLVVAVLSPLYLMPFSTSIVADVVIVMHRDSAVSTAVRAITDNVPNVNGNIDAPRTIIVPTDDAPQVPSGASERWWAGAYRYGGVHEPILVTSMSTTIKTPSDLPGPNDRYYVLLSAWVDSPNCYTYVQVGFSTMSSNAQPDELWSLTTSYTKDGLLGSPDGWMDYWEYIYDPHEITLASNTYYTFEMAIDEGYLTFNMYVEGYKEFTKTVYTGGNWLLTSAWVYPSWRYWPFYPCLGYTLYEEVLQGSYTPSFNFTFSYIYADAMQWKYWAAFYQNDVPQGVEVYLPSPIDYVKVINP